LVVRELQTDQCRDLESPAFGELWRWAILVEDALFMDTQ
jgi:hypothetical protein